MHIHGPGGASGRAVSRPRASGQPGPRASCHDAAPPRPGMARGGKDKRQRKDTGMHYCTLVLGPDPEGQVARYSGDGRSVDWHAIGGRYTGNIILKAGATSGRVYGDAISSIEARMATWDPTMQRGTKQDPGVDQALARDVEWERTSGEVRSPALLVDHGEWHEPPQDAQAAGMVASLIAGAFEAGMDPDSEWARATCRRAGFDSLEELLIDAEKQMEGWNAFVAARIAQADPDTLVTVLDVHQ